VIDGSTGFLVDDELAMATAVVAGSSRATATRGCGPSPPRRATAQGR